jgi:hypothetical protein
MALASDDLVDWIADRQALLIAAWTPQIEAALSWDRPFSEVFAGELHNAMHTTLLRGGTEMNFFGVILRSNTGLDEKIERTLAERFYSVTLKLARAASRSARWDLIRSSFPVKRSWVVGDSRTNAGHLALDGIILPHDHPFWQRWHPPLDMDCRCSVTIMTQGQFERSGQAITSNAELADRESRLRGAWPIEFLPLLDFR